MEIRPDKRDLIPLLKKARKGKIVLPEFQRNFVWTRDDVNDLLVSRLKRIYIGTFLFLEADKKNLPFVPRPIAGRFLRHRDRELVKLVKTLVG